MTGQQGPRIIPPAEARSWNTVVVSGDPSFNRMFRDLAHTAAVLGEQRDKVLALHDHYHWCQDSKGRACSFDGPHCPTARALGVTLELRA